MPKQAPDYGGRGPLYEACQILAHMAMDESDYTRQRYEGARSAFARYFRKLDPEFDGICFAKTIDSLIAGGKQEKKTEEKLKEVFDDLHVDRRIFG